MEIVSFHLPQSASFHLQFTQLPGALSSLLPPPYRAAHILGIRRGVGSRPPQYRKSSELFWLPSASRSHVYSMLIIKCPVALHLKSQCTYLNLKILHC